MRRCRPQRVGPFLLYDAAMFRSLAEGDADRRKVISPSAPKAHPGRSNRQHHGAPPGRPGQTTRAIRDIHHSSYRAVSAKVTVGAESGEQTQRAESRTARWRDMQRHRRTCQSGSRSSAEPCSMCGGTSRCAVQEDGEFGRCFEVVSDWPVATGGWLHRLEVRTLVGTSTTS